MACSAHENGLKVAIFTRLMQSLPCNFELVSFFISSKTIFINVSGDWPLPCSAHSAPSHRSAGESRAYSNGSLNGAPHG